MKYKETPNRKFQYLISAPFIYGMIFPLVFLDISIEIYQNICFRLYGIDLVKRSNYIRIDRHKLSKLNKWEKLNCVYCGYGNGMLPFATAVAAETEKFWCGIRHESYEDISEPPHHKEFEEYGKYN